MPSWHAERNPDQQCDAPSAIIVTPIRILSDCLVEAFARDGRMKIVGFCSTSARALDMVVGEKPDLVLLDANLSDSKPIVIRVLAISPWCRVVAMAIDETEENVVAWAKAGACGYVPNSTPLGEIAEFLADIAQGRQKCAADVAAGLMRRSATEADPNRGLALPLSLTDRERDILRFIGAGLSNKDIARQLNISVATTKAHVHNLLGKLNVRRRGEAIAWMHGQIPGQSAPAPNGHAALWRDVRGNLMLAEK